MNKRWVVGLSILVMLSVFIGGCQSRPTAEEIVAKMQEVEASIDDAHAVVEFDAQAEGMDLEDAVTFACAAGAVRVSRGCHTFPTREDVESLRGMRE